MLSEQAAASAAVPRRATEHVAQASVPPLQVAGGPSAGRAARCAQAGNEVQATSG
jgi:hypothetical protein